jgi:exosortase C (VPDSG-CTERM-specific)
MFGKLKRGIELMRNDSKISMITSKSAGEKVETHRSSDHETTTPGSATPATAAYEHRLELRRRGSLVGFFLFGISLTAVFVKPLLSLVIHAAGHDLHSHILLIPFVSAYLIYIRRDLLPKDYAFSPGWAALLLIAGVMSLAAAWIPGVIGGPLTHNDYLTLMALAFVCFLAAGGFLFLGRKWMAAATFPFAFLIFMVPMPDAMADALETASKVASAEAANLFFNLTGTPTLRNGTIFALPGITIEVAQECSGIRSSWVLLITSLLAANLFLTSSWRRTVLVGAVIPLGILRNGFRILFIGLLCVHAGPGMIHSIFHRRAGPPFFVLSLIPLFLLLWWLRRGEAGTTREAKQVMEPGAKKVTPDN